MHLVKIHVAYVVGSKQVYNQFTLGSRAALKLHLNIAYQCYTYLEQQQKNPASGRQSISRPMRIVAPIPQ